MSFGTDTDIKIYHITTDKIKKKWDTHLGQK